MRLATFNVEKLFDRPKVMSLDTWAEGKPVLEKSDEGPFVMLRQNRGDLLRRPKAGGLEIVATGRSDWSGSVDLIDKPVDDEAMRNTARVIIDLKADVLAVVEAENRPALKAFNDELVKGLGGSPFANVMLIDGNDSRGIDVGLMTGAAYPIGPMRSHVNDEAPGGGPVFSRDCPEYGIELPSGKVLWVLVNHLKSKGYGTPASSDARRLAQAQRVKAICADLVARGEDLVAVVGDFNDTPGSAPLAPLLQHSDLKDAFTHPLFDNGGFPGTYGSCTASNKIDFLLLSPALYAQVQGGGVWRKGMWPGVKPVKWATYPEVTKPQQAASDHAAAFVDLGI